MSERRPQRLRITFEKGEPIKYVAHLDLLRAWERILRRARAPLAYSQGFNPHPKITIAMPSPVGCTGAQEELDIILDEPLAAPELQARLEQTLPPGIAIVSIAAVPLRAPARPSMIRRADYWVTLRGISRPALRQRVDKLVHQTHVEIEFRRKRFDLRPLIEALTIRSINDIMILEMRLLRNAQGRLGRPDAVLAALDLGEFAQHIHRTQIIFETDRLAGQGDKNEKT